MSKIKSIIAREIKDSRGRPTVEVELETEKGTFIDSCPSGASTGENEALELRDADGVGVFTAIKNVNEIIAPKLRGKNSENQKEIDQIMIELDGTENKSRLGANAILPVSMAVCRAGAAAKKIPLYQHMANLAGNANFAKKDYKLPFPMFNILNGGRHATNGLDIQEFMIIPQKETFLENLAVCNKIFNNLRESLAKNYGDVDSRFPPAAAMLQALRAGRGNDIKELLGDEGGFAPPVKTAEQALFLLKNAVGDETHVSFAIDCAASEFYNPSTGSGGKYILEGRELGRIELLEFYKNLTEKFDIISIEDPFAENDWNGFEDIFKEMEKKVLIIGDDLTTTNIKRIKEAHNKKACNGVILKLNQIGTVLETIEAANLARSFGWVTIVSHRSGETMDDFIADLAVAVGDFIKSGSPAKEERMVKYKRLLEIEKEIKNT